MLCAFFITLTFDCSHLFMQRKVLMLSWNLASISPVIKRKGESQVGEQDSKEHQIFRKTNISYPPDMHTSVLNFAFLPCYRKFALVIIIRAYVQYVMHCVIVQFKKRGKHPWRSVNFF